MIDLRTATQQIDKLILYIMQWQVPEALERDYKVDATLEEVLAQTQVNETKTAVYNLTAPGQHAIWLQTPMGEICCHVRVRLAINPEAPLFLYHHGLAEIPFTSTWQRLLPKNEPFPAHSVAIQAPFHDNFNTVFKSGFASVGHIYQMFAGSMRLMALMQTVFEDQGTQFAVVGGLSWGGITSILYEGLHKRTRAVMPMYASPNLAQVMWDSAEMFGRQLPVSQELLNKHLDFTPYYNRCDPQRMFPVLGTNDLFFRFENHAPVYPEGAVQTVPSNHVGAMSQMSSLLRQHVRQILAWAEAHPLNAVENDALS